MKWSNQNKDWLLLLLFWLILTLFNLNKAFHMDDTFHLEAASNIIEDPLHPMSHEINWKNDPHPMHYYNQPPLFFYLVAGAGAIVGFDEVPLHLIFSIFALLSLYIFHKLTALLGLRQRLLLLALFAFCPATIINQNLMMDIPILSIVLSISYFTILANRRNKSGNYLTASLLLGLGLLMKYSLLPVLITFIIILLIRKDYKHLPYVVLPILMLTLWSFWNLYEFGSIHLLDRDGSSSPIQILSYLACLGAITPFSIAIVSGWKRNQGLDKVWLFVSILVPLAFLLPLIGYVDTSVFNKYLHYFFLGNGIVLILVLTGFIVPGLIKSFCKYINSDEFVILLFFASIALFMALFAPFIATRHILLSIPFLIITMSPLFQHCSKSLRYISMILTILLGFLHGISDWKYADYYRKMANLISLKSEGTTWTVGHWGWQWYSAKNQMSQYHLTDSQVKPNDLMIIPNNVSRQRIDSKIQLELIEKYWEEPDLTTYISGCDFASMYNSFFIFRPPWEVSLAPIDTIFIYKVHLKENGE